MNVTKLLASRESWKRKAVSKNLALVAVKRKLRNAQNTLAESEQNLHAAIEPNQRGSHQATSISSPPTPVFKLNVRVLGVSISILSIIPCNAVSDPSSIVSRIARARLGMLIAIDPLAEPWVAIVDTSISFGKAKALVVLRVPLSCFQSRSAPKLNDVHCI